MVQEWRFWSYGMAYYLENRPTGEKNCLESEIQDFASKATMRFWILLPPVEVEKRES